MSDDMPFLVEPGWVDSVDLGDEMAILFYDDGVVRFRHVCDRMGRPEGAGGRGFRVVCAPQLQIGNGHTVVTRDPLTIVASILCPDCARHGYVANSKWVAC